MKNSFKYFLGLIISLIFAGNSHAWTITSFHADIQINLDGSANITETIVGDFSQDLGKHGIFRYIPFRSKTDNGKINNTPISNFSVTDENNIPRNFQKSNKNDNILLKIGDADKYVQAEEIYVIKYVIDRVPKEFPENDFAEFYWNVTGNGWDAVIEKVSAQISLPTSSSIGKTICFTGVYGSTESNCAASIDDFGVAVFETIQPLQIGQALTVDYGFDRGIVQAFEPEDVPWWKNFFNKTGVWILAVLMPILSIGYAWREKKKLDVDKPIIPKYEPPEGLHPTMIGTVMDGRYDKRDFTAGIIDLAVNGWLEIEKKKVKGLIWDSEEYFLKQNLEKMKPTTSMRRYFYLDLFGEIPRKTTTSKELFTYYDSMADRKTGPEARSNDEVGGIFPYRHKEHMHEIFTKIKKQAESRKYLNLLMPKLDGIWIFFIAVISGPIIFGEFGEHPSVMIIMFSLGICLILGLIFYPNRTKDGFELAHEAKCYKEFLETAELDKLNWAEKQEIFEKNLPYAVAFGLTDKWASVFGETIKAPQWMHTGDINHLSRDISSITSDISSNISAPQSSSGGSGFSSGGGGFSGGGSGGGGGGSW